MSNAVRRGELYPAADGQLPRGADPALTRFVWTGEFRTPQPGEWFLSGAIVEAYHHTVTGAPASFERHIARMVTGRIVWDEA